VTAVLELRGAARAYDSGGYRVEALRPLDLLVGAGEYLAVMGPSGSGKSTLLNLMGLLSRPSRGQVLVNGRDTTGLDDTAISGVRGAALGFVFQAFHLLPRLTALENVELPLVYGRVARAARQAAAMAALKRVGLEARAYSLPGELSGGERQRVAIARAVARRPLALLCDEPTGNLDSAASALVTDLICELNDERVAVVVATHDREVAAQARRLLRIEDGRALEDRRRDGAQP
jgi:putative ABC transport system ATP-binding protein